MEAVVLFSGGQDSCTVLEHAVSTHGRRSVLALSVVYGQRHAVELDCAREYTRMLGVQHQIIDAAFFGALIPSALTGAGNVSDPHPFIPGVPASFVPNRNAFLLTLAHSVAQARDTRFVYGGMCETDYSGYPDCRDEFVSALSKVLDLGSNAKISVVTPLMHLTKAQTWDLAAQHDAVERIVEHSHTCYNGDHEHRHDWGYGCDACPSCDLRKKGWEEYKGSAA